MKVDLDWIGSRLFVLLGPQHRTTIGVGGGEVASSFAFVDDNHDNESDNTVVVVVP